MLTFLINHLITYLLTPYSTVPLQKLTGSQLVKKFPTFYRTRRFITAFTSARHLSLSWASSIQSVLPHPNFWRYSHLRLGLPKWSVTSQVSTSELFYTPNYDRCMTCHLDTFCGRFCSWSSASEWQFRCNQTSRILTNVTCYATRSFSHLTEFYRFYFSSCWGWNADHNKTCQNEFLRVFYILPQILLFV